MGLGRVWMIFFMIVSDEIVERENANVTGIDLPEEE